MIQVIKLLTGEEIVGDVTDVGELVVVKQPCYLQMVPARSDPNKTMMALIPYAMYVEGHTIEVRKDVIVWQAKPVDDLYNQYNSAFGSGIQLI